jgi:hypothetical protein
MHSSNERAVRVGVGIAAVAGGVVVAGVTLFAGLFVVALLFSHKGLDDRSDPTGVTVVVAEPASPAQYRLHPRCRGIERPGATDLLDYSGRLTNVTDGWLDYRIRIQPRLRGAALGEEQLIELVEVGPGETADWEGGVALDTPPGVDAGVVTCDHEVDLVPKSSN